MTPAERNKKWRETNHEYHKARCIAHNQANRDHVAESHRAWQQANPDKVRTQSANRRARKRNAFVESVDFTVVFERDGGVCQICHEPIGDAVWHVDHVMPLVAGGLHCYANVQLSHGLCNLIKGAKVPEIVVG